MTDAYPIIVSDETSSLPPLEFAVAKLVELLANNQPAKSSERQAGMTLKQLFERYMQIHARPHCRSWKNMESMYKNYFTQFSNYDLYEIKRTLLQDWHASVGRRNGHHAANRALEFICGMYNKAIQWELIEPYNPTAKITKFHVQPRERFLQADELARFLAAVQTLRYPATRDALLMCLFTGARKDNVRTMRWEQINWELKFWRIPKTKNGDSQVVPLTPYAMAILKSRKVLEKNDSNPWVFHHPYKSEHIKKFSKAWAEVLKKADIKDLRIHDLRRSMASWQAITGANTSTIAATLNHKSLSSTAIYARLNTDAVRAAMGDATQAMIDRAGIVLEVESEKEPTQDKITVTLLPCATAEPWVSEKDVEEHSGITAEALRQMRHRNFGPRYLKQGYSVLYRVSEVEQWMLTEKLPRKYAKRKPKVSPDASAQTAGVLQ
jgi:integrase